MSIPRTAMILAAGRGERMRPLTDTTPKPLALLGGRPLIEHHIDRLAATGIERVVINLAWLGGRIREFLGSGGRFGVEVLYSDEGDRVLGTGGGIFNALPLLGPGPFWLVSADIWTDYCFGDAARLLPDGDLAHLVMVDNPDFHPQGDFCLSNGRIDETTGQRLTYASLAVLRPELFAGCDPGVFELAPLLRRAMRDGRVGGERFTGSWHNIGTLAQLQMLNAEVSRGVRGDRAEKPA